MWGKEREEGEEAREEGMEREIERASYPETERERLYVCVWRPEVEAGCFPPSLFILLV